MSYKTLYMTFVCSKKLIAYLENLIYDALFYRADGCINFDTRTSSKVESEEARQRPLNLPKNPVTCTPIFFMMESKVC